MKSAKPSIKHPLPKPPHPPRVAVKIQRRCYGRDALTDIGIHHFLRRDHGPSPDLIGFHEAFFDDGHICTAYQLHGRSLDTFVDRGPLPLHEVRTITRQLLGGLVRMHEYGFAHTDVKPLNILYRRTPKPRKSKPNESPAMNWSLKAGNGPSPTAALRAGAPVAGQLQFQPDAERMQVGCKAVATPALFQVLGANAGLVGFR